MPCQWHSTYVSMLADSITYMYNITLGVSGLQEIKCLAFNLFSFYTKNSACLCTDMDMSITQTFRTSSMKLEKWNLGFRVPEMTLQQY